MTQPTRFENILDLFLIDNPTLVKSVDIKPGIADQYAVLSEVYIKPQVSKQKPRLMFMYKKAAWEGLESHMHLFQKSFLASHEGKSINLLWEEFKGALHSGIEKHVPQHTISTKIVSEYDQKIPQSQTADNPVAPREEEPLNHHKTPGRQIKQSNQLSLPHQDDCNTRMDIK